MSLVAAFYAIKTHLLYIVSHFADANIMERFWLTERVPEEATEGAQEFLKAEESLKKSVKLINNHFYVDIPLKVPLQELQLGDLFDIALNRFYSLENKFKSHPEYFKFYKKFIDGYVELGHAKIVDINSYDINNDPVYFLAHHAVLNEGSKIRGRAKLQLY